MTILNEYIYTYTDYYLGISSRSFIGAFIIIIAFCIFILACNSSDFSTGETLAAISVVVFVIGLMWVFMRCNRTKVTRYEVIITESIDFKEFNDKYKLIQQRGDIYVIEERNNNS